MRTACLSWPAAGLACVLAAGALALSGCGGDPCTDTVVRSVAAPAGHRDAVVVVRECGATTGWSTVVSVVPDGSDTTAGGTVFVADDDHGAVPLDDRHALAVTVRWTAGDRLTVGYPRGARTFRTESERDGVRIRYVRR